MSTSASKYMPQLDGLRTIAVSSVMVAHWIATGNLKLLNHITGEGGVNLFFVLSGFLITNILMNGKEQPGMSNFQLLKQFYIRRLLRIFPLYYFVVIAGFIFSIPAIRNHMLWFLTYTANYFIAWQKGGGIFYGHLWSLAVEEQFYIVFPFVLLLTPKRNYLQVFFTLIAIAILFKIIPYLLLDDPNLAFWVSYAFTPGCFDAFAIGAILAYYFRYQPQHLQAILRKSWLFVTAFILWLALSYFEIHMPTRTVFSIFCFWIVGMAATHSFTGAFGSFLKNKVVVYLGRISYGLYVYHHFMPWVFNSLGFVDSWQTRLMYLPATVLIATASWFLFEKPINDLKRYFEYKPSTGRGSWIKQAAPQLLRISLASHAIAFIFAVGLIFQFRHKLFARFNKPAIGPANIVMYGDSRVSMGNWPGELHRNDVYNAGISSKTVRQLYDTMEVSVLRYHPKICFIQAGINDIRAQLNSDSTIKYFQKMVIKLKEQHSEVVICSIIPVSKDPFQYEVTDQAINDSVKVLNKRLVDLASANGVHYLDINKELAENDRVKLKYTLDGIHVNSLGFQAWSKEITRLLSTLSNKRI